VLCPGGRLGLTAWTMEGEIGDFFKLIGKYSPPPVEGAGSSLAWGDPSYCERLLGNAFELSFSHHDSPWVGESGDDLWTELAEAFGPIVMLLRRLDDAVAAAFRSEMIELFGRMQTDDGVVLTRPYLLVLGTKR